MMLVASFSMSVAGPGGTNKVKSRLTTKVKRIVANAEVAEAGSISGDAVVFFRMDEEGRIKVKGVFGTNDGLIEHVEKSLEGEAVSIPGLSPDEEFQIRLKYVDLR